MSSLHLPRTVRRPLVPLALALLAVVAVVAAFVVIPPPGTQRDAAGTSEQPAGPAHVEPAGGLAEPASPTGNAGAVSSGQAASRDAASEGAASEALSAPLAAGDAAAGDGAAGDVAAGSAISTPELGLKVIQSASVRIDVKRGRVEDTVASAIRAATAAGGHVVSTSLATNRDAPRSATVLLRVPGERFDTTLTRLREAGRLRGLDISSRDVTEEYVDVRSRLRHDRAVAGRLLLLLGKTESVGDALAVQARLDTVQQQIEVEQGRLNYLERLTAMSTLELVIEERRGPGADRTDDDGFQWGFADALEAGAERFAANVNRAIVALGGVLPALILLAALTLGARAVLRRRRLR